MIHTVWGFGIVNKAKVDVFLELSSFFYDPVGVGNLISGSSAFSKSRLYIWKFSVHLLLKPTLKDFEHYLARMWNEHNCKVVWIFFGIGIGMKTDLFQSCSHCWVFQICWNIEWRSKVKSLSRVQLFATPWTLAYQDPRPWDFPGKSTGVGCHFLLQEIFLTQGSNPGLPHSRQTLYRLSHQRSP